MYHSITFGEPNNCKNTWDDWHLIPSSKPMISMPTPKTKYVDVPGTNGQLDLSEVFGAILYGDREGELSFIADPRYLPVEETIRMVASFIHGKRIKMVLEDDPIYYYIGRFTIEKVEPGQSFSGITIKYQLGPYKYRIDTGEGSL